MTVTFESLITEDLSAIPAVSVLTSNNPSFVGSAGHKDNNEDLSEMPARSHRSSC